MAEAVICLDAMLRFTSLTEPDLWHWLPRVHGWRGVRRARHALALASGRVRSPWESRLRVLYVVDGGLPTPEVNAPVTDLRTGEIVAEADLLDHDAGLVLEFDGATGTVSSTTPTTGARKGWSRSTWSSAGSTRWTLPTDDDCCVGSSTLAAEAYGAIVASTGGRSARQHGPRWHEDH